MGEKPEHSTIEAVGEFELPPNAVRLSPELFDRNHPNYKNIKRVPRMPRALDAPLIDYDRLNEIQSEIFDLCRDRRWTLAEWERLTAPVRSACHDDPKTMAEWELYKPEHLLPKPR